MAIDRWGRWWTGDAPSDLDEFLSAFSADSYPAQKVVHAICASCGGIEFSVTVDVEEGFAVRTCVSCGHAKELLDSDEHPDDATLEAAKCPCGGTTFNTAVGFAFVENSNDVRWVYLAVRCTVDRVLGCCADWKIDYAPSEHLLQAV